MSIQNIRLGLIGAGRMGSFHGLTAARHIAGARLTTIADPTPVRARAWPLSWAWTRSTPTHNS